MPKVKLGFYYVYTDYSLYRETHIIGTVIHIQCNDERYSYFKNTTERLFGKDRNRSALFQYHLMRDTTYIDLVFIQEVLSGNRVTNYPREFWENMLVELI